MALITYDPDVKALYVYIDESKKKNRKNVVAKTIPLGDDCYLDVDEDGKPVGLEILYYEA